MAADKLGVPKVTPEYPLLTKWQKFCPTESFGWY
jgi:hypothetical protein